MLDGGISVCVIYTKQPPILLLTIFLYNHLAKSRCIVVRETVCVGASEITHTQKKHASTKTSADITLDDPGI